MGWFSRRRSRSGAGPEPDDERARPVALCYDDAAATSTVLAAAGVDPAARVILRHLLWLPPAAVDRARELAAQERYRPGARLDEDPPAPSGLDATVLVRVQQIDARTVSQERTRMASLASRLGGSVAGWAVLDVPDGGAAPGD